MLLQIQQIKLKVLQLNLFPTWYHETIVLYWQTLGLR